jgi:hypothetical protein
VIVTSIMMRPGPPLAVKVTVTDGHGGKFQVNCQVVTESDRVGQCDRPGAASDRAEPALRAGNDPE